MTIFLVRHGETVWNTLGRQQGRLDSPLTNPGIAQAEAAGDLLGELLDPEQNICIKTSPLKRAYRTESPRVYRIDS